MSLVGVFNESWSWTGFTASRVRAHSPMGHLILSDAEENFAYLDTDGLSLIPLGSREEAEAHLAHEEAQDLWWGGELIASARERLGEAPQGSVYSLKPIALLNGDYSPGNVWIISLEELIAFTGDAARQLKDLPEGAQYAIKVTD